MTTHPTPRATSDAARLAMGLPLLVVLGAALSWVVAVGAYLGLWLVQLAEREGMRHTTEIYAGGCGAAVLVVLLGLWLAGRALVGPWWWLALPGLLLGPLVLSAQVGLL